MTFAKRNLDLAALRSLSFNCEFVINGRGSRVYPNGNYLLKVNNRNTRTRREICSKLTVKMPENDWCLSGVSSVNFEHILYLVAVFLFLTWNT